MLYECSTLIAACQMLSFLSCALSLRMQESSLCNSWLPKAESLAKVLCVKAGLILRRRSAKVGDLVGTSSARYSLLNKLSMSVRTEGTRLLKSSAISPSGSHTVRDNERHDYRDFLAVTEGILKSRILLMVPENAILFLPRSCSPNDRHTLLSCAPGAHRSARRMRASKRSETYASLRAEPGTSPPDSGPPTHRPQA